MRWRFSWTIWVCLVAAGCGGSNDAPRVRREAAASVDAVARRIVSAAPTFASRLNEWWPAGLERRLVIRGPVVVGFADVDAPAAARLSGVFRSAAGPHLGGHIVLTPVGGEAGSDLRAGTTLYDARLVPADRARRGAALELELIDPARGGSVFVAKVEASEVEAAGPAVAVGPPGDESPEASTITAAPEAASEPIRRLEEPDAETPTPSGSRAAGGRAAGIDRPPQEEVRGPSAVVATSHGAIYLTDEELLGRLRIVRVISDVTREGLLRTHVALSCRRGDMQIELRGEHYDAHGRPAGSTKSVELKLRAGRSSTYTMLSRGPAVRYALFIRSD
jgi:hypothetical protein